MYIFLSILWPICYLCSPNVMFYSAKKFNQNLCSWETKSESLRNRAYMFSHSDCSFESSTGTDWCYNCQPSSEPSLEPSMSPSVEPPHCEQMCGPNPPSVDQNTFNAEEKDECWNTSEVTDMSNAFKSKSNFVEDLNCW